MQTYFKLFLGNAVPQPIEFNASSMDEEAAQLSALTSMFLLQVPPTESEASTTSTFDAVPFAKCGYVSVFYALQQAVTR